MHPLYQILQVITVDGQRYIDRNNNFSSCTSQIIWKSFMLLVVWILVFRCGLGALKCYIDDAFLVATSLYVSWYEPYQRHMPTNQCKVLQLQDEIHLLHTEKKQILGHIIPILGFEVDANLLMAYLNKEKQEKLISCIQEFTNSSVKTLHNWLRLARQLNWVLNVYPWLRLRL